MKKAYFPSEKIIYVCVYTYINLIYKAKIKFKRNIGREWAAFPIAVLDNGVSVMCTVTHAQ